MAVRRAWASLFLKFFLAGAVIGLLFFATEFNEDIAKMTHSEQADFKFQKPAWRDGLRPAIYFGLLFGVYGLATAWIAGRLIRRGRTLDAALWRAFALSGAGLMGCFYLIQNAAAFFTEPLLYKILNLAMGLWVMFLGGLLSAGFGAAAGRFLVKDVC